MNLSMSIALSPCASHSNERYGGAWEGQGRHGGGGEREESGGGRGEGRGRGLVILLTAVTYPRIPTHAFSGLICLAAVCGKVRRAPRRARGSC